MKAPTCFFLALLLPCPMLAQDLTVSRDGQAQTVRSMGENRWSVMIDGQEFLLVEKAFVNELVTQGRLLDAESREKDVEIERLRRIVEEKDRYIARLERETEAAATHIADMRALSDTQKNLIGEYRDQVRDLKKLANIHRFAFEFSAGLADLPNDDYSPMGSVGVEIDRWTAKFQLGDNFTGFLVGLRLPFGF